MNIDPLIEKKESRFCDLVGFSYEASMRRIYTWFELYNLTKCSESQHDGTRLTTNSPTGKRYAY